VKRLTTALVVFGMSLMATSAIHATEVATRPESGSPRDVRCRRRNAPFR
jgi:hypothetical protein